MPKRKAPLLRRAHRGQKGVTLIEVLIVIAILGVIAGIIIYAVGPFRGAGTLQSANTEASAVRTAVQAYLAHGGNDTTTANPGILGEDTGPSRHQEGWDVDLYGRTPIDYFDGTLKAEYTINTTAPCIVIAASPDGTGNWNGGLVWDYDAGYLDTCQWIKP